MRQELFKRAMGIKQLFSTSLSPRGETEEGLQALGLQALGRQARQELAGDLPL